jgi:hypothetical protein
MATKAELVKLAADLKRVQQNLEKAKATATQQTTERKSFTAQLVADDKSLFSPATDERGVIPVPAGAKVPKVPATPAASAAPAASAEPVAPVKTMAIDTFRNTLALFFGKDEVAKPWVSALYSVTSKYYNTGSTIDESLNLALMDSRNNKDLEPFTKRFKGLYDLQDKLASGLAIEVPTIAEFFKSEIAMGDVLRLAGMGDLATQDFLGGILGLGKSVTEVTALINTTFAAIDNAPEALKRDLQTIAPGVDRTSIARALLLGKDGAELINKQIAATSVFSAAKSQGIGIDMTRAGDYAARGTDYQSALTGFGEVSKNFAPLQKLTEIGTGMKSSAAEAQNLLSQSIFENNATAQQKIDEEAKKEIARFRASSGTAGSRSLASSNRANRKI